MMLDTRQQATADAAFGTDLYTRLAGPGNLVFSPASIAAALRMALIGARGETADELARGLHLPGPGAARVANLQLTGLAAARDDLVLRAVNTAWIDSDLDVRDEFLDQPVTVQRVTFRRQPEAAREAINAAVAEQTAGKIRDLIQPGLIGILTRLVLVNAIYLKARWEHQFPAQQTKKAPFYPERAGATQVDMMHVQARLAYHRGDGYQAVLLPYRGGPLAMAIVLPDGPLSEFTGRMPAVSALLTTAEQRDVDLRLPRFKIESGFLLRDTLQALGMGRAFSGDADFSGITDAGAACRSARSCTRRSSTWTRKAPRLPPRRR